MKRRSLLKSVLLAPVAFLAAKLAPRAAESEMPKPGSVTYDYDLVRSQGWVELHDAEGKFRGICHPQTFLQLTNDLEFAAELERHGLRINHEELTKFILAVGRFK